MEFQLMCEDVQLTTWGDVSNDTDIQWEAKFSNGDSEIAITSDVRPLPQPGTVYYFAVHTSE